MPSQQFRRVVPPKQQQIDCLMFTCQAVDNATIVILVESNDKVLAGNMVIADNMFHHPYFT